MSLLSLSSAALSFRAEKISFTSFESAKDAYQAVLAQIRHHRKSINSAHRKVIYVHSFSLHMKSIMLIRERKIKMAQ